jgi:DNA polymerase-3 subunit alpha
VLSADMDNTDKVVTIKDECDQMKLAVLAPDINESVYEFTAVSGQSVRYGLGAIKGVGAAAVEALVLERDKAGPYVSLEDICRRVDPTKLNRRVFEALIRSGALDSLGQNRATWMARLPAAMLLGEQNVRAAEAGQNDMFGLAASRTLPQGGEEARVFQAEWSESVRLAGERDTLGLYLTGASRSVLPARALATSTATSRLPVATSAASIRRATRPWSATCTSCASAACATAPCWMIAAAASRSDFPMKCSSNTAN